MRQDRGVPRDRRKALELFRQAAQEVPEARQAVRRLEKAGRAQRIVGWLLVAYAMLMGAGLWEGSAGDRIIWLGGNGPSGGGRRVLFARWPPSGTAAE